MVNETLVCPAGIVTEAGTVAAPVVPASCCSKMVRGVAGALCTDKVACADPPCRTPIAGDAENCNARVSVASAVARLDVARPQKSEKAARYVSTCAIGCGPAPE